MGATSEEFLIVIDETWAYQCRDDKVLLFSLRCKKAVLFFVKVNLMEATSLLFIQHYYKTMKL